jgi:hypothetical protein
MKIAVAAGVRPHLVKTSGFEEKELQRSVYARDILSCARSADKSPGMPDNDCRLERILL